MTMKSITWAKTLMDTLFYKAAEPITANLQNIDAVYAMLGDDKSKKAYEQELAYKILFHTVGYGEFACKMTNGIAMSEFVKEAKRALQDSSMPKMQGDIDMSTLAQHFAATFYYQQYAYQNGNIKIGAEQDDIVLNCGACYGDTAVWAYRNGAKKIYSFEIDPANIAVLEKTVQLNIKAESSEIVQKALGASVGEMHYTANPNSPGGGVVSADKKPGSIVVPVTTIDQYCADNKIIPNFIKMDIEGSEFDALRGAAETLRIARPKLAVCLYHRIEDMWRIPLLIKQIEPDCVFYCKKSHPYCEFVLFAECK